jgi:hypothetical protein
MRRKTGRSKGFTKNPSPRSEGVVLDLSETEGEKTTERSGCRKEDEISSDA